jgi:phenylacetate-CoA ligase
VPVYSYYGLSEKCCLASGFTDSVGYEFIPTYCYTEIVNGEGNECASDGELGNIVCTGLNSIAAPLIRYRTNDVAVFSTHPRVNHAGWKTVKEIRGRISEFIVDKKGSIITFTCSDEIFWQVIGKINAYQYVQVTLGRLLIRLEINQPLADSDYDSMKRNVAAYYPEFEVEFTIVGNIPRTRIGKFRYLIQELPIDLHT